MLKRKELAKELNIHINTVDRSVKRGMPCIKIGKSVRFEKDKVMEWLKSKNK